MTQSTLIAEAFLEQDWDAAGAARAARDEQIDSL